jgi:pyruvate kinase
VSDKPELLSKLAILRGVTPVYMTNIEKNAEILAKQLVEHLSTQASEKQISSLLVTQLESVEGVGSVNVCRLLHLNSNEDLAA